MSGKQAAAFRSKAVHIAPLSVFPGGKRMGIEPGPIGQSGRSDGESNPVAHRARAVSRSVENAYETPLFKARGFEPPRLIMLAALSISWKAYSGPRTTRGPPRIEEW